MKEDLQDILNNITLKEQEKLLQALVVAREAHTGQMRKSGEEYIIHPISITKTLWEKYHDFNLCIAGLLHDTVEDCDYVLIEHVYDTFGEDIGFLVDSANKRESGFYKHDIVIEDKVERLLWAGMQDVRTLLLKLADREHNIKTLGYLKESKQVRLAFETQAIFAPLKKILGYDENIPINEIKKRYISFLKKNKINTPSQFKKFLYKMSFKELSDEMYNLVYNNSDAVVWEIEDKGYFKELTKDDGFKCNANLESMWSDGDSFKASFTFNKGCVVNSEGDFKISSYKN